MSDKPGIKTRRTDLDALAAAFDQISNGLVSRVQVGQRPVKKQRKGLRLALRKLCYRILART